MAEAIGAVAGIAALAQSACESSIALYQLVKSFRSHNSRVRELVLELGALCEVLRALRNHTQETKTDVSSLEIPLQQCTSVCADFGRQLAKCAAHSDASGTSFRDWAKLRYMGDDIDGFRRLISSYKLTMTIALNDANLYVPSASTLSKPQRRPLIVPIVKLRQRQRRVSRLIMILSKRRRKICGIVYKAWTKSLTIYSEIKPRHPAKIFKQPG